MRTNFRNHSIIHTDTIPDITPEEAYTLLETELKRFLAVVKTLTPDEWNLPTACTEWSIRDMVAHQAGGYASGTGYKEMFRQYSTRPQKGQLPEDAVNQLQIRERKDTTPPELIAELETVGPAAIQNWAHRFSLVKLITIPHPVPGWLSIRYLMTIIHSRDTWMHRMDICRAANRTFEQDAQHDGRIVALIMRDVGKQVNKHFNGSTIQFELGGTAGGCYQIGVGEPAAIVSMDALDFSIFVSGRYSYAQAIAKASISGDEVLAKNILQKILILF